MKSFRLDFSQFRGLILPYDEYGRTPATVQHRTSFFIEKYARYKFILKLENTLLHTTYITLINVHKLSGLNRNIKWLIFAPFFCVFSLYSRKWLNKGVIRRNYMFEYYTIEMHFIQQMTFIQHILLLCIQTIS